MGYYSDLQFNNGDYIPTYSGLPLDTIQKTGDVLSGRHYQNLAEANRLALIKANALANALPGAKDYIESNFKDIEGAIEHIAQNGGENYTGKLNAIANRFMTDQGMLAAADKAAKYNEFKKTRDALTTQGFDPLWDKDLEQQYLNSSVIDPETKQLSSLYSNPFNLTAERTLNYMEKMDKVLDPLQANAWETSLKQAATKEGMTLPAFLQSTKGKALTAEKVRNYIDNQGGWEVYKDSPEFRQQFGMRKMSKDQIYNELLSRGLAKVYSQYDNQYIQDPEYINRLKADLKGRGQTAINMPTLAPGKVLKNAIPYNEDGIIETPSMINKFPEERKMLTTEEVNQIKEKDKNPDIHPQFEKDLTTAAEVLGQPKPKAGSPEATELVKKYNEMRNQRVSNSWVIPIPHDLSIDASDDLQRQYALRQYMDQEGNVVDVYGKDGKMTDEFIKLTGGDPSKFKVESVYDAKNHYATAPGSNENFVQPLAVVALDKDGNSKRFIASSQPGSYNVTPELKNTNKIYALTNMNPGQEVEVANGVKVKTLVGSQVTGNAAGLDYPVLASVPGINNGQPSLYKSPEDLADVLANPSRYGLTINPIYLNIK